MPFFTSNPKATKIHTPVFAGLDDPFNFPTTKMRYNSRSISPVSTTDSGYGSIDDDCPLSPKARVLSKDRRRVQRDGRGHWRTCSYEYQSEDNDNIGERQPILKKAVIRPDPKRTFTAICDDRPRKERWYTKRVYGEKMEKKDRCEGLTELQRSMAPVLRRASPEPSLPLPVSMPTTTDRAPRPAWTRKQSTLLHPSPPPAPSEQTRRQARTKEGSDEQGSGLERGRTGKAVGAPKTSPALAGDSSSGCDLEQSTVVLRSPRNRSPTPLGIPMSSERQPAPTPLRIRIGSRKASGQSVLHSCFSDDESGSDGEQDEEEGGDYAGSADDTDSVAGNASEDVYVASAVDGICGESGGILARTALVARAQRVKVRSPGLKKSVEGREV
ncbi:hypothetical protein E8E11_002829 [Didymella keratinophila]|nr:hypothetical protein E8E11_002829 [Didymella keratinophila]